MLYISIRFFFCTQRSVYVMRISDLSSDVCSSDLVPSSIANRGKGCPVRDGAISADLRARRRIGTATYYFKLGQFFRAANRYMIEPCPDPPSPRWHASPAPFAAVQIVRASCG